MRSLQLDYQGICLTGTSHGNDECHSEESEFGTWENPEPWVLTWYLTSLVIHHKVVLMLSHLVHLKCEHYHDIYVMVRNYTIYV